jgi:hypothetical protein
MNDSQDETTIREPPAEREAAVDLMSSRSR